MLTSDKPCCRVRRRETFDSLGGRIRHHDSTWLPVINKYMLKLRKIGAMLCRQLSAIKFSRLSTMKILVDTS